MTNYRRSCIAGASYFFTVNLADRTQSLLTDHIALLRSAFEYTRERHPFVVDAIVILPEHLHAIWTLPEGDRDFAMRWRRASRIGRIHRFIATCARAYCLRIGRVMRERLWSAESAEIDGYRYAPPILRKPRNSQLAMLCELQSGRKM